MPVRRLMLLLVLLLPTRLAAQQAPPEADRRLAREILAELVAINTIQDSGATRAARALARRLTAAGFAARDVQLAGPKPRKQNLVVRLRGQGSAKPILFLAHLDVVEARREDWTVDPFRLTERDGWLYGRGTIDIKDEASDLVTNLIRLKRERYVPDRDIIVALTDDEEGGDDNGAQWLLANRPEWIAAAYAINLDAGGGQMQHGRRLRNPVQTSEKIYATYLLEVTGPGGHSSLPEPGNTIYSLARGLDRLSEYAFPVRLTETTRGFFDRLGAQIGGETGRDLQAIAAGRADSAAVERVSETPMYNSSMRNTCVATMLQAGHAENALAAASAGDHPVPPAAGRVPGRDPRHAGPRRRETPRSRWFITGEPQGAPESLVNPADHDGGGGGDALALARRDRPAGDGPVDQRRRAVPPGRNYRCTGSRACSTTSTTSGRTARTSECWRRRSIRAWSSRIA